MARVIKESTFITGLEVVGYPRGILNKLYRMTSQLLEKMPEESAYKKYTKEIINQRVSIINSTEDVKVMEDKIGCGQIEEVIEQAKRELELARNFIWMKPWEHQTVAPPKNQWQWPIN